MEKSLANPEVECLKTKKAINDNFRLSQKAAADAVERAILTGELLQQWKGLLPHGGFEKFVEAHFEGSLRTAQLYMEAAKGLSKIPKGATIALLEKERSMKGLLTSLKPAKKPSGKKGKPGGRVSTVVSQSPASPVPASGEAADFGTCPNCGGKKWTEDEFGATCAKCNQPHGEPVGDQDEDRIGVQRSKTVKTVEALLRAFDDLNRFLKKPEHVEAIASCKFLLKTARAWK